MSFALQESIYNALVADVPLMAAITGVFDNVEKDYNSFPYVTLGENTLTEFDTDSTLGSNNVYPVHVWSRQNGSRKQALEIVELIYTVLNRNDLTVTGYNLIDCMMVSQRCVLDPDGETVHATIDFRILLERT